MLNLYKISQAVNKDLDTYDSAIVAAETAEEAQNMTPNGIPYNDNFDSDEYVDHSSFYVWCEPEYVFVEKIGVASPNIKAGVILASFNAG